MAMKKAEKKALCVAQFLAYLKFCLYSQPIDLHAENKRAISPT